MSSDAVRRAALQGFSLLELLVVVAIIALLASYVGPKLFSQIGKSEHELARAQIDAFGKALAAFRVDLGRFPRDDEGLRALDVRPAAEARWRGPYLEKPVPADPWGEAYRYRLLDGGMSVEIVSLGADRRVGGEGDAADISSLRSR